jgi:trigger factor
MTNLNIEKQKGSTVVITGELPWDDFKQYRGKALKKLSEMVSVDGFRKGHIPEDILIKKVGEISVLEEMASLAFQTLYPTIVTEHKIEAIGRPSIQITKLASENPLGFSITTAILPEVKLPDYKKIAGEINTKRIKEEVTQAEIDETIEEIRTMKAKQDLFKKMQSDAEHVHDENCNHDHEEVSNNKDESIEDVQKRIDEKLVLPEFNDDFVKTLGDFTGVEDFKTKLKENLSFEKERRAQDKHRLDIIDAILEKTELELPHIMIDAEVDQIIYTMKGDIARMGMTFEKYLESVGKTEEDIRKDVRPDGEKRAKLQVVVASISKGESLTPDESAIEKEIELIKKHYPDASAENVRAYVHTILTNDIVFKFLDAQ